MSTEADIVERLNSGTIFVASDEPMRLAIQWVAGADKLFKEAATEITKLRAERDAAAIDIDNWMGMFDPPPQLDVQQIYLLRRMYAHAKQAAARDMRERCAAWHDEQCYSGHCGETTADKIFRQRHNKMHEEAAYNIRLLEAPAMVATDGKSAT